MGGVVRVVLAVLVLSSQVVWAAGPGWEAQGYRLRGYMWDAVLSQRWAVFEDAAHPERPLVSELVVEPGVAAGEARAAVAVQAGPVKLAEMVVRSGDAVTLWKNEGNVRMQLAAVAEGNGGVGERVQLRVTGAGVFGSTGWRVEGVIRGPGSVEME